MAKDLPHIVISGQAEVSNFTSPQSGGKPNAYPTRNRTEHGSFIKERLEEAWKESENEFVATHSERHGVYLEFQSAPEFDLVLKSLENLQQGIRLCNVRSEKQFSEEKEVEGKTVTFATVFVPNDKKAVLFNKVEKYLTEETEKKNPKNASLVNSIEELRKALLVESFWMDDKLLIPKETAQWCEIWLRDDDELGVINRFEKLLKSQKINSKSGYIKFPERTVKLAQVTLKQLEKITLFSDDIAEYRIAKNTAEFLLSQTPAEQNYWVEDLIRRLSVDRNSRVSVCILDTGVNNGHSLISPVLLTQDCQCVIAEWGEHDHKGHGTLMAGLAAFGDLKSKLESSELVHLKHTLESIKILPPTGQNDPELWGDITKQAISLAEIQSPDKKRISCMAVTASDTRDRGRPTSWSGAIDQITSGSDESEKRLLILSAGNITFSDFNQIADYPNAQLRDSIHDPGQSWNALTVGAYTQLSRITDPTFAGYVPIARINQLSPFSTTSKIWEDKWPIKPEVVFEGGNVAVDPTGFCSECDDLKLISTFHKPHERLLEAFGMTSAATAQAANFAAKIQAQYPDYWPETVRALIVHSANWPVELKNQFARNGSKTELKNVLRACGYGVPDLNDALFCASNSLTLISEAEIHPYEKKDGKYRTKDMHLYKLPWPSEILQELGEKVVEMRITLSYFIEPGPGEIGWKDRYRYASHALRFDLNSPTETQDEFIRRINKAARDEEEGKPDTQSASEHWVIGQARDKGSIHSDIWHGTASDLASSNLIAISPRIGWWRERHHLQKHDKKTRYSLIVSIKTSEQNIDIYTPVKIKVAQQIPIEIRR